MASIEISKNLKGPQQVYERIKNGLDDDIISCALQRVLFMKI